MVVLKSDTPFYGERNKRSPGQFWYLFMQCDFFLIYKNFNYGHCCNPLFAPHLFNHQCYDPCCYQLPLCQPRLYYSCHTSPWGEVSKRGVIWPEILSLSGFNKIENLLDLSVATRADFTEQQLINIANVTLNTIGKHQPYISEWFHLPLTKNLGKLQNLFLTSPLLYNSWARTTQNCQNLQAI